MADGKAPAGKVRLERETVWRLAAEVAIGLAIGATLLFLLWTTIDALVLVFGGILLAIFLRMLADFLEAHGPIKGGWALLTVCLTLAALLGVGCWLVIPSLVSQVTQLSEDLPRNLEKARESLSQTQWGRWILGLFEAGRLTGGEGSLFSRAAGIFSTTAGAIGALFLVLFIGLYLAAQPSVYKSGVVQLMPPKYRERAESVLDELGTTLRYWLLAQLIDMTVVGVLTYLGLLLLGVPLALTLAIMAFLLTFVSYIGPIISFFPAALVATQVGPWHVFYVFLLYTGVHVVEGYVVSPIVQKRAVTIPPALTIFSQTFMGLVMGALGVIFATPLAAMGTVLVKMLYVRDSLGEPVELPGHPPGEEAPPAGRKRGAAG